MSLLERSSFERELEDLGFRTPSEHEVPELKDCMVWDGPAKDGMRAGMLIDPLNNKASTVKALLFEGKTSEFACVLGGVHGSEPGGVLTTKALIAALRAEYTAGSIPRPKLSVLIVPNLFADKVSQKNEFGRVDGTREAKSPSGNEVEPNRNFPRGGEGWPQVLARRARGEPDVLDPDQRRFRGQTTRKAAGQLKTTTGFEASELLPQNRALVNIIGCLKPTRMISVHDHGAQLTRFRGNDAGCFVDPRGGFDLTLDAPFTPEGRQDDISTALLLAEGLRRIQNIKDNASRERALRRAFRGNAFDAAAGTFGTVHYAFSVPKTRGTSLGMWGPASIPSGAHARPGILTVTLENPARSVPKEAKSALPELKDTDQSAIAEAWAAAIRSVFLEGR